MDFEKLKSRLAGCYVTIPTAFEDSADFPVNHAAIRAYVRFLIDNGLTAEYATLLAGGAAGDFSTMSFQERIGVGETVVDESRGRVPLAFGGQSTSTLELVRLAQAAQSMGFDFLQVSCPFYFTHTEADFEEFVMAAAKAAPNIGIIVYNTFWTSTSLSFGMIDRLAKIENVVGSEMGDAANGRDGVRGRHLEFLQAVHDHRQQSVLSLFGDALVGRTGVRGASVQLLARMGHQPHRRGQGAATMPRSRG